MNIKFRIAIAIVLAVVFLVPAYQGTQAAPLSGNGPFDIKSGTLVYAEGEQYQIHSKGGFHTHHWAWSGYGIVGKWDGGFKLYSFRYCSGEIDIIKEWYGWVNYCTGGKWYWEYLDPDTMSVLTSVG